MCPRRVLVVGTHNPKKGQELAALLEPLDFGLLTLADFESPLDVVEDGDSFTANSRSKANEQARHLGHWVLGEDSGIVVDALNGAPGIYSARYSGEGATDESNNLHLLEQLGKTQLDHRTAHYVCHMAVADPTGTIRAECEAVCRGRILFAPAGTGGFGYDPLFEVIEYHRTFGQLGPAVKATLSHRARAMQLLVPQLLRIVREGMWD